MDTDIISYFDSEDVVGRYQETGELRVHHEGTHPKHGEVALQITHKPEGIVLDLRHKGGEVIESGYMETADLLSYIH